MARPAFATVVRAFAAKCGKFFTRVAISAFSSSYRCSAPFRAISRMCDECLVMIRNSIRIGQLIGYCSQPRTFALCRFNDGSGFTEREMDQNLSAVISSRDLPKLWHGL